MSDDRELMERAAKAAGARWSDFSDRTPDCYQIQHDDGIWREWNPLTDDGDALRLAVALRIDIDFDELDPCVEAYRKVLGAASMFCASECAEPDPAAATRRAIVRAAAEIARRSAA
jgi:hypothetical protein